MHSVSRKWRVLRYFRLEWAKAIKYTLLQDSAKKKESEGEKKNVPLWLHKSFPREIILYIWQMFLVGRRTQMRAILFRFNLTWMKKDCELIIISKRVFPSIIPNWMIKTPWWTIFGAPKRNLKCYFNGKPNCITWIFRTSDNFLTDSERNGGRSRSFQTSTARAARKPHAITEWKILSL